MIKYNTADFKAENNYTELIVLNKIMIVEDDASIREELCALLVNAGYLTDMLEDFTRSSEILKNTDADLILMDINIPGLNGEQLLQEIRKTSDIPVIMVTSRTTEIDEILSMSYGADDYITKPYNPAILLLRISALLKRCSRSGQSSAQAYRDVCVNAAKGSLSRGGKEQVLTKNEMIIFQQLLDKQGEIVTRDILMTALWDNDEFVNDNALSVNVSRLRSKLAELGLEDAVETRKKQGYILK